jgi:hypothetical protein
LRLGEIVQEVVNKSNHPIKNPLLLVTESWTSDNILFSISKTICKCQICHCYYATSDYHGNELSINTLHERKLSSILSFSVSCRFCDHRQSDVNHFPYIQAYTSHNHFKVLFVRIIRGRWSSTSALTNHSITCSSGKEDGTKQGNLIVRKVVYNSCGDFPLNSQLLSHSDLDLRHVFVTKHTHSTSPVACQLLPLSL